MSTRCRDCQAGLFHCHGTIIRHSRGRAQCTEADCDCPEIVVHTFVIDCHAVGCTCADSVVAVAGSAHRVGA
ncbi:hypothetical protein F0Q45_10815 [Mycobacterium simiae]|uniref:Uncharacterized protein n=1 Tax=Mycobacterium simiae TaxID=1784 RepID=A0A5B1BT28_MYCSI|nr:hypothetical protein [Mycobacterium simiae]KAA1250229.1 hypothetical protein F0Q45_10815 [Mycobacterium simiae]